MGNKAQKQFVSALNFLLKKEGHGSQARLARALNIDSGYLNNILKGRTPGSQEKKEYIAEYFGLQYEAMLSLGRQLLSDRYPDEETWQSPDNQKASPCLIDIEHPTNQNFSIKEAHATYQLSTCDKNDKNLILLTEWINLQDEPGEYWILLKMFLRREEPEFKDWLGKRSKKPNQPIENPSRFSDTKT